MKDKSFKEITKERLIMQLFTLYNEGLVDCGDEQCDNKDCVIYRALEYYVKNKKN